MMLNILHFHAILIDELLPLQDLAVGQLLLVPVRGLLQPDGGPIRFVAEVLKQHHRREHPGHDLQVGQSMSWETVLGSSLEPINHGSVYQHDSRHNIRVMEIHHHHHFFSNFLHIWGLNSVSHFSEIRC